MINRGDNGACFLFGCEEKGDWLVTQVRTSLIDVEDITHLDIALCQDHAIECEETGTVEGCIGPEWCAVIEGEV